MDVKKNWPFEIVSAALVLAASMAAWSISGSEKAFIGIWAGGIIGLVNFKWLGSIVKGVFAEGNKTGYTVRYLLKFLFIIGSSALLIYSRAVDPLAFLVGFTIIVVIVSLKGTEYTNRS